VSVIETTVCFASATAQSTVFGYVVVFVCVFVCSFVCSQVYAKSVTANITKLSQQIVDDSRMTTSRFGPFG